MQSPPAPGHPPVGGERTLPQRKVKFQVNGSVLLPANGMGSTVDGMAGTPEFWLLPSTHSVSCAQAVGGLLVYLPALMLTHLPPLL